MRTGTKSILFGYHSVFIHPFFVALAWWKLNGFPWDPRLWLSFLLHDIGYLGKAKMDDSIGASHPELGAKIMSIFGKDWYYFNLLHSRFYADTLGMNYSALCTSDKLAFLFYPDWLIWILCKLSGEAAEYTEMSAARGYAIDNTSRFSSTIKGLKIQTRKWLAEHEAGKGRDFAREISKRES